MIKKLVKEMLALFLAFAICMVYPLSAKANNNPYNFLKSIGVPTEYLNTLSQEHMNELYEKLYGENVVFGGIELITESIGNPAKVTKALEDKLTLALTYYYIHYAGSATRIKQVYVDASYNWTGGPIVKGKDSITLNWDESVLSYEENSFSAYAQTYLGTKKTYSTPAQATQGGLGYNTILALGNEFAASGALSFTLIPSKGSIYSTQSGDFSVQLNMEYTHNTNPTDLNGFSIAISGTHVSVQTGSGVFADTIAATKNIYYKLTP